MTPSNTQNTMLVSFDIKLIRRDQKQRRNGEELDQFKVIKMIWALVYLGKLKETDIQLNYFCSSVTFLFCF